MDQHLFTIAGLLVGTLMAVTVIFVRLRSAKKPISAKKIMIPPLFMTTGFAMFHLPEVATPLSYDLFAFFIGTLFSIPLILTSRFEVVNNDVYLKSSKAFIGVLLTLFAIRLGVKLWMGDVFTPMQTAGLFFVLAYGMILPWRMTMLYLYRHVVKNR